MHHLEAATFKIANYKHLHLLVGCDYEEAPPFTQAEYSGARIENAAGPKFELEATRIYGGLLGLSLKHPEYAVCGIRFFPNLNLKRQLMRAQGYVLEVTSRRYLPSIYKARNA